MRKFVKMEVSRNFESIRIKIKSRIFMEEKIKKLKSSISIQLGNLVAGENVKIPLQLFVDNNATEALNSVEVVSLEEAEEICFKITNSKKLENRIKNENAPLYLTLVAFLPNINL